MVHVDQIPKNIVVVSVARFGGEQLTLLSVYFEGSELLIPYLDALGEVTFSADRTIIGGYINAKSA